MGALSVSGPWRVDFALLRLEPINACAPMVCGLSGRVTFVRLWQRYIIDLAQRSAVFQHPPGLVGMEVDFEKFFITQGKQRVAIEVFHKIIVNYIFVQILASDQQLGIISVFDHFAPSLTAWDAARTVFAADLHRMWAVCCKCCPAAFLRSCPPSGRLQALRWPSGFRRGRRGIRCWRDDPGAGVFGLVSVLHVRESLSPLRQRFSCPRWARIGRQSRRPCRSGTW